MLFRGLLQKSGWRENVEVKTDASGMIASIEPTAEKCVDFALPGFRNSHSHAFQYAMAGIAENHLNPSDDFWSWREAMYKLALTVDPGQLESIASMLYAEMLRHGYTHVAEFHYLHNDKDGSHYSNRAEMGSRLIAAAAKTGINITLVPVYYNRGGFDTAPSTHQRRFISKNYDEYFALLESSANACKFYKNARIGFGVHSLRAASIEDVRAIAENGPADAPFHIHIAEQLKEVDECKGFSGMRPVEYFIDNIELSARFNLVHATHLNESELVEIVKSDANVVICPSTEGNLGDGFFSLKQFKTQGGRWSIGTDSHAGLNPFEELRLLDYGQRLVSRSRNTFGKTGSRYAIETAFDAGANALGIKSGDFFEIGTPFNACVVSSGHPLIATAPPENRLNAIVYSSDESMQNGAVANGKNLETEGLDKIRQDFINVISELRNR